MIENTQTLGSRPLAAARPRGSLLTRAADGLIGWIERARERRALAAMNEAQLKDVGLTRADVQRELDKPFWRR